jgi:hypothetical protein
MKQITDAERIDDLKTICRMETREAIDAIKAILSESLPNSVLREIIGYAMTSARRLKIYSDTKEFETAEKDEYYGYNLDRRMEVLQRFVNITQKYDSILINGITKENTENLLFSVISAFRAQNLGCDNYAEIYIEYYVHILRILGRI